MYFLVILTTLCAPVADGMVCLPTIESVPMQVESRQVCIETADSFNENMLFQDYVHAPTGQVVNFQTECRVMSEESAEEE